MDQDRKQLIKQQYASLNADYQLLCEEIVKQIEELMESKEVNIGVPIEYRVKGLESIIGKIERYGLDIDDISKVNDLAGIRITVLFRRDVKKVEEIIDQTFNVHRKENTEKRLSENQFGYGSIHYEVSTPEVWGEVPSLSKLNGKKAEIQLRTVSQHSWAAASHVLQYKKEEDVPIPLRRSINRVAALLETADLEFERLLNEREKYINVSLDEKEKLNVENLKQYLQKEFPENEDENEPYSEILELLTILGVDTVEKFREIFNRRLQNIKSAERIQLVDRQESLSRGEEILGTSVERIQRGVFYTYVGIIRVMLDNEFETHKVKEAINKLDGEVIKPVEKLS